MGLIQKKDEKDVVDDIEVIGRGEGPDDQPEPLCDLVAGKTAEDISGTTAAKDAGMETEPDPELLDGVETVAASAGAEGAAQDAADVPETDEQAEASAAAAGVDVAPAKGADVDAKPEAQGDAEKVPAGSKKSKAAKTAKKVAADAVRAEVPPTHNGGDGSSPSHTGTTKAIVALVAVLLIAVVGVGGYFLGSGGFGSKGAGSSTLTEKQLDSTVASWTYNGAKHNITAREAIESQYSLDSVKDDDGNYPAPSADSILAYVRNQVMLAEADKQGVSVSDDDLSSYAASALGSSDFSTIASQYGVTEDQAKSIVREQATIKKLYEKVVPSVDATMPEAPTEPSDGNTATASKEYADYIIKLAGDEWDADKGTWASTDGTIASALSGETFTADSATYAQAQTAYYAAYQAYAQEASKASSKWTEYANKLFASANITLYGIFA